MDKYQSISQNAIAAQTAYGTPYTSPSTGMVYYSWGVEYLGLDRMSSWVAGQQTEPVTVAVLDSGVEPCNETQGRILEGLDMFDSSGNGWNDMAGHGTHVAGTILDCTRGLDVSVFPVRVLGENGKGADSSVIQGLKAAIANDVDVINMSLGGRRDFDAVMLQSDVCRITPIDNKLQVAAHAYSENVLMSAGSCKTTPKFERAKSLTLADRRMVYISGTAAIRGEESLTGVGIERQFAITMENISQLTGDARCCLLRVYLKYAHDYTTVKHLLSSMERSIAISYLETDVCRNELLIEIEGIAIE